ncbi:hypothetical protein AB1207_03440 [Kineococcus endophyticus]|uniref:Uncharacterized protein n=1 Tax=Kineococcus endophyticus TaxID=1181883 RepID=A0ABV3P2F2_9ACTN
MWLVLLSVAATPLLSDSWGAQPWLFFPAIALQLASRALRRRAWWYVPLRDAGRVPDRVDTAFWTVFAVVVVVLTLVVVQQPSSEAQAGGLWPLLLFTTVPMWFSWNDRDTPEPPGRWGSRIAPCSVAALAVLVLGATHGRFGVTTAVVAGTVIAAGTVVSLVIRRQRT